AARHEGSVEWVVDVVGSNGNALSVQVEWFGRKLLIGSAPHKGCFEVAPGDVTEPLIANRVQRDSLLRRHQVVSRLEVVAVAIRRKVAAVVRAPAQTRIIPGGIRVSDVNARAIGFNHLFAGVHQLVVQRISIRVPLLAPGQEEGTLRYGAA